MSYYERTWSGPKQMDLYLVTFRRKVESNSGGTMIGEGKSIMVGADSADYAEKAALIVQMKIFESGWRAAAIVAVRRTESAYKLEYDDQRSAERYEVQDGKLVDPTVTIDEQIKYHEEELRRLQGANGPGSTAEGPTSLELEREKREQDDADRANE